MKMNLKTLLFACFITGGMHAGNHKNTVLNDSLPVRRRYVSTVSAFGQISQYTKPTVGIKYCGAFPLKHFPRVALGPSLFYERLNFNEEMKLPRNVAEARIVFVTPGLNTEVGLNSLFSLQFGLSVLVGGESLKKVNLITGVIAVETHVIGGAQLEQVLLVKTSKKNGLKLGVGAFERFISSDFYESDVGGRFYLGFEF